MGKYNEDISRSQWIIGFSSCLSCLSCATIIVTYLRFKQIRKQAYIKVILYIAISDFMASLCFVSIVQDGSILCWMQGLLVNYFQLATVLWVDVVVWHLYRTVLLGKRIKNASHYHWIAWGVPFMYIALTLSTNNYGVTDGERYGYCWVVDRAGSPSWTDEFWELFQLSIIWMSSIAIIVLMYMIWMKTQQVGGLEGCSPYIQKALKKLFVYPFILVFCYILVSYKNVSDIRFPYRTNYSQFFGNGADLMLCLQGFFTAMAFWIGNQSIARLWYDNCFGYFCCCCCIPFSKPHDHGDDSLVNASYMTSESTEVSVYHRPSLNVPLLKDDTKVHEKYIPSSSESFNNDSRMRGSILSIFDFIVPKNNADNDENGTEEHSSESNHSNNSNGTTTNATITGNLNVVQHSPIRTENELSQDNNGNGVIDV